MKGLRPPGPTRHFLTGNSREFYKDQLGFLTRSAREFGDVVRLRFLHVPVYLLSNPQHIEWVFSSRNFIKPMSLRLPLQRRIFGNGLLSSSGEVWLRERRMTQPAFHRDRLAIYGAAMIAHTEKMLTGWHAAEVRDVYDEMKTLALEIAAKCLFSADVKSDGVRDVCNTITKAFASQGTSLWVLDNIFPTPNNLRFRKAIRQLDEIIYELIAERLSRGEEADDLLSLLLFAKDEDGTRMNKQQLRDALATLFFASHEAVALALTWTCYLLALHPDIQDTLVNELHRSGRRETSLAAGLSALGYTRMVIKEALRLYPPNRSVGREALNDCEIGDYHVPAGTQLLMSQWVVQRDSRYFAVPEEFKPERWTTEFTKQLPRYAYFPFGGGPRVCVGQDFAMMEAVLVIATILRRFRLTLVNEQLVEPRPVVLLRPGSRIKIRLADR
jgi:cytochrome P450